MAKDLSRVPRHTRDPIYVIGGGAVFVFLVWALAGVPLAVLCGAAYGIAQWYHARP